MVRWHPDPAPAGEAAGQGGFEPDDALGVAERAARPFPPDAPELPDPLDAPLSWHQLLHPEPEAG